jgi:maltose phosphorylase
MGQRANFEERYSGESMQGNYFAGIFYPDKTRVGWWKIGYPKYFGKMINSVNWVGIDVEIDGEVLDLAECKVTDFRRVLDMREASLSRSFTAELRSGRQVRVDAMRFISAADTKLAAIRYAITPLNFSGKITVTPYLDGDVVNKDSNYGEQFWEEVGAERPTSSRGETSSSALLHVRIKKTKLHEESHIEAYQVCSGMCVNILPSPRAGEGQGVMAPEVVRRPSYIGEAYAFDAVEGRTVTIEKYVANVTSLDVDPRAMAKTVTDAAEQAAARGFDSLFEDHKAAWAKKWEMSDIVIGGDVAAQQGIRFNIFQLNQTYTGEDARLNIGPKGFTGEKYGGGTYWDTEAFCFPFYLNTSDPDVARNLLIYRYRQLGKAIENGEKLGFSGGAALYPMVTINGEECHNEWEITFEEIHRNGAIAYAIYNYVRHTGDTAYLTEYGLEVLIALSRFWAQRATYSQTKRKYVILGVTGPNEYENNVNNNWYTNYIAAWTLRYTLESLQSQQPANPGSRQITNDELAKWREVADGMYLPIIDGTDLMLQNDGFLDKEMLTVADIPSDQRPINQHWSWDRILRSVFIKQGDVLQGMYFFMDKFPVDVVRDNFYYYEPKTVHESSLSASIHSVIASQIENIDKAYELYVRTARLDLDDYNNEVHEGLHITSMAGTWLAIVEGFARKRITEDGRLSLAPLLPPQWSRYAFKIKYRGHLIETDVRRDGITVRNHTDKPIELVLNGQTQSISANGEVTA